MPGTVQIQMPQMGESVTEGTVLEWHKQEGDFVNEGETVVEVSTDKIDAEVPAPATSRDRPDPQGPRRDDRGRRHPRRARPDRRPVGRRSYGQRRKHTAGTGARHVGQEVAEGDAGRSVADEPAPSTPAAARGNRRRQPSEVAENAR